MFRNSYGAGFQTASHLLRSRVSVRKQEKIGGQRSWEFGGNQTNKEYTDYGDFGGRALHPRRVRRHADVQVSELAERFAVLGIQAFEERRIIELGLAVRFAQIAQRMQSL